jgi:hypothetical protein
MLDEIVDSNNDTEDDLLKAKSDLTRLKERVVDLYGDGHLPDVHYNPLIKRIELHLKKFTVKTFSSNKGLLVILEKEGRQATRPSG